MSIYAISDLHLSLDNSKPMDIFKGWKNYVERLQNNWNSTVKSNDTVVIAGDISWAMRLNYAHADFNFINSLSGRKIILKGNHDYWWGTINKINEFFNKNGFDTISALFNNAIPCENVVICGTRGWEYKTDSAKDLKILDKECMRLIRSIEMAKSTNLEPIVFLHYPPIYDNVECQKIINILLENNIKKCYYGHIHGLEFAKKATIGVYKGIEFNLISCDYLNFSPLLVI